MAYTLENSALQLELSLNQSRWSLTSRMRNSPSVEQIRMEVAYRKGWRSMRALESWRAPQYSTNEIAASPHGPLRQIRLITGTDQDDLRCTLTFALPEQHPFLLWKVQIENRTNQPLWIERLELLAAGFIYKVRSGPQGMVRLAPLAVRSAQNPSVPRSVLLYQPAELAFFANGWQSWSYAGVYSQGDTFRRTRLGFLRTPAESNPGTPRPTRTGVFASDMFGILGNRTHRNALLAGFLSQKNHFGSLEALAGTSTPALRLWANGDYARLDPGAQMVTDWAYLQFLHIDEADPLGSYLEAVAREHDLKAPSPAEIPTGWCSWHAFSTEDYVGRVSAADIRRNVDAAARLQSELPLRIFQIDDGFAAQTGDWFDFQPGFPSGVAPLSQEIAAAGLNPGLWLAPFIAHPASKLAREHPDWLLHNRLGRPVNAGYLWNTFPAALDLTHPEALRYTGDVIRTAVQEWGFPYIKLDFLYAAALPGRRFDPTRTRAQTLRAGLESLRAAAGEDAFLLGCGCPLGPAIGLVDAMRIGADTARRWRPSYKKNEWLVKGEDSLPSAFNAARNALARAAFHRRLWINDPDCLLLSTDTHLSSTELQTVATVIALTGGSLLLSDDLPGLPEERLRIAAALLPLIGRRPHVLDWFEQANPARLQLDLEGPAGAWHLLGVFNWTNRRQALDQPLADTYLDPTVEYVAREFWSGASQRIQDGRLAYGELPPHGTALFAVRPWRPHLPQYLGSDLHISQGLEVTAWEHGPAAAGENQLSFSLERPGAAQGKIELGLPRPPRRATINGQPLAWQGLGDGRYEAEISFQNKAELMIRY